MKCEKCELLVVVTPYHGKTLCWHHLFEYVELVMEMGEWADLVDLIEEASNEHPSTMS